MAKSKTSDLFDLSFDENKVGLETLSVGDVHNGVPITGNYETDTEAELSETLRRFKESSKSEENTKEKNASTEYWFATYFASKQQRDLFLTALGLLEKLQDQYIDGHSLARAIGVDLLNEPITPPKRFRGLGKDQRYDIFEV